MLAPREIQNTNAVLKEVEIDKYVQECRCTCKLQIVGFKKITNYVGKDNEHVKISVDDNKEVECLANEDDDLDFSLIGLIYMYMQSPCIFMSSL